MRKFIELFLHENLKNPVTPAEASKFKQARFLLYSTFLVIPVLLIMTVVKFTIGDVKISLYLVPLLAIMFMSVPISIKKWGKYKAPVGAVLTVASTLVFYRTYETGGLTSYTIFWFFLIPFAVSWFSTIKWLITLIMYQIILISLLYYLPVEEVTIENNTRFLMTLTGFICAAGFAIMNEVQRRSEAMIINNLVIQSNELQRSNDIYNIIGKMRHEINNPLMVLLGSIRKVKRDKDFDKLDILDTHVNRISDVLNRMQSLRKLSNKEKNREFKVNEIITKLGLKIDKSVNMQGYPCLLEESLLSMFEIINDVQVNAEIRDGYLTVSYIGDTTDLKNNSIWEYSKLIIEYHGGDTKLNEAKIEIALPVLL